MYEKNKKTIKNVLLYETFSYLCRIIKYKLKKIMKNEYIKYVIFEPVWRTNDTSFTLREADLRNTLNEFDSEEEAIQALIDNGLTYIGFLILRRVFIN